MVAGHLETVHLNKYKIVLDHWNKETGGGNGEPYSFVDYCDRDARWLVVVFLKDLEANFLLASNAGGRMPGHLQQESGFNDDDVSSFGEAIEKNSQGSSSSA